MVRDENAASWEALNEIALDLRWSWSHASDKLWAMLDPEMWALTQNPWLVLQSVSRTRVTELLADREFSRIVSEVRQSMRELENRPLWFQQNHPEGPLGAVAYFSMEFMLCEALPIYSGGLGNVAGDQLKSASDMGVPVIGVGLLYQQGYFRQEIDANGFQQALYPFNEPSQLPIQPVRKANGEALRLSVDFPGWKLWIRPWEVKVGRVKLYLMDTNDPANLPAYRSITSELYGGGSELRLRQELLLGIGGWRLLRALGLNPEVCHLNEGHAAFAALERARFWMMENKQTFREALAVTRAGNLFTTHTPVAAGFDRFPVALLRQYLSVYAERSLGISFEELLRLGRDGSDEFFNMAYLAIRSSGAVNGVSRLHGQVSRRLFQELFPRWPEDEVPVGHVTNGVHMPTWDSREADELWTCACGKERWIGTLDHVEADFRKVSAGQLWEMRSKARRALVEFVRERIAREWASRGRHPEQLAAASTMLDENALTLGFARRFAAYKRPNLLLADQQRLIRILTNLQTPVQLIIAGKAHPEDAEGQALIKQWMDFVRRPEVRRHCVFLSDYDMLLADQLVHGVDVWLNTPRRPWEASGTSGMKVLVNGGLNLSELDGWWAEAYTPEVGWAIGDGQEHDSDPAWDAAEANAVYGLIEQEIIPEFYARDHSGIPQRWVTRMRESIARLTPAFSANRSVRQYTEEYYLRLAATYRARAAESGTFVDGFFKWKDHLAMHWAQMHFGELHHETRDGAIFFEVAVYLNEIDPEDVCVELYADAADGGAPERHAMKRENALVGSAGAYFYSARLAAGRPAEDFTPRVVPWREGVLVPLESPEILWQR